MASNDPTDTGGLFVGRRPGTAPVRYREGTVEPGGVRQRADRGFAALLLAVETVLCLTLWGPQPMAWLWVGSQVDYQTESVSAGIVSAFLGMLASLFFTLMVAKRVDHAWKLVRRASGIRQERGALERIFVVTLTFVGTAFAFWFFVIEGPGPTLAPRD
ncbi:MAG TPA: hypothetical protein VF520_08735 [Thermoleophilaceae bacterium]|jgi:hypothetical protein